MNLDKTSKSILDKILTTDDAQQLEQILHRLAALIQQGDNTAKHLLGHYIWYAKTNYFQIYALKLLAENVKLNEHAYLDYFAQYINVLETPYYRKLCELAKLSVSRPHEANLAKYSSDVLTYHHTLFEISLDGYLNIKGNTAYPSMIKIIINENYPLYIRSYVTQMLANHSKQTFNDWAPRGAHKNEWDSFSDANEWILPIKAINKWANAGFPDAKAKTSRKKPQRDPALDHPKTPLEQICSTLEKNTLITKPDTKYHLVFALTDTNDIAEIQSIEVLELVWKIPFPSVYLEFLQRFSPYTDFKIIPPTGSTDSHEYIDIEEDVISLARAHNFIDCQKGYALNAGEFNQHWPAHLIIIGFLHTGSGDEPFIMDLSQSNGMDAPIYFQFHDGDRKILYANSILSFLEKLNAGSPELITTIKELENGLS